MSGSRSLSIESVTIRVARLLAIISAWAAATALVMGYFFSPMGAMPEPTFSDLADFGCAFTIAGAVAAAVTLILAGKSRWAVEIALAVALTTAATASLAYLALWAAPWTVRGRMDAWSFLRLQQEVLICGMAFVNFHVPLGVGLGGVVGATTGTLIAVARRRPRLARSIAFGLFATCASEPVRPILFGLVYLWGLVIQRLFAANPMAQEHVWATAAIFGAITGASVACLSVIAARHPDHSLQAAPARPCADDTRSG